MRAPAGHNNWLMLINRLAQRRRHRPAGRRRDLPSFQIRIRFDRFLRCGNHTTAGFNTCDGLAGLSRQIRN